MIKVVKLDQLLGFTGVIEFASTPGLSTALQTHKHTSLLTYVAIYYVTTKKNYKHKEKQSL